MFQDSNTRMKNIMKGEYKLEDITAAQREFEGQIKLVNAVVNSFAIASKNKRAMIGLDKMNIMDPSTSIDLGLGNPERDTVKCPLEGKVITRANCLDYSGENFEDCKGCDTGKRTKNLLLGESI